MERSKNIVTYSDAEQKEFGVISPSTVEQALETSGAFEQAANVLDTRVSSLAGDTSREAIDKSNKLRYRASRLRIFSTQLKAVCGESSAVDQFLETFQD